jgi:hypothetical protein
MLNLNKEELFNPIEELEKFLKENKIDYYIGDNNLKIFADEDNKIPIFKMSTLLDILNYGFNYVSLSTPFTLYSPYLLIEWRCLK